MEASRRPWEAGPWRPVATYSILAVLGSVFLVEQVVALLRPVVVWHGVAQSWFQFVFVIDTDWVWRPWTLLSSTLAHNPSSITHILFNGLFLFFFGPSVERLLGVRRYVLLFLVGGAVSGIAQVHTTAYVQTGNALALTEGAIGASGALMALFGALMAVTPRQTILIYGLVPVPMWLAGVGYAALDVVGALDPASQVGHFAHLSGMALGLLYGTWLKSEWRRKGVRLVQA